MIKNKLNCYKNIIHRPISVLCNDNILYVYKYFNHFKLNSIIKFSLNTSV